MSAVASALVALVHGAFGSWYAFGSGTLVRSTPLFLTGLSVAIAFRAGVLNIGAEGQFLIGAATATAVGLHLGGAPAGVALPIILTAGAIGGALWAGIAALLRARFHVLEVISTILLNFIAADLVSYLVRGPLQEPLHIYPQTASLSPSAQLPRFGAQTRLHLGFVIAVGACIAAWWIIKFTAAGFRLRAVGANPAAAAMAGQIDVGKATTRVFLVSGALAGVAGAIEVSGVTYALYENLSPGYGYTAIAVALMGQLHPAGVLGAGLFFGALEAGATAMQRDAGVPSVVGAVIQAAIIVVFLVVARVRAGGRPAS